MSNSERTINYELLTNVNFELRNLTMKESARSATDQTNPCLTCGACCAFYQVTLYWTETTYADPNGVPLALTEDVDAFTLAMKGTLGDHPKCQALAGTIGESVRCTIYPRRPGICRDFPATGINGFRNPKCGAARARWGLAPLPMPDGETSG